MENDKKLKKLKDKIENSKTILNDMTQKYDSLYHKDVVHISEKIDNLIVEYVKLKQNLK